MVLFPAPAGPSMAMMSFFSGILFVKAHQGNRRAGDRSQVAGDRSQVAGDRFPGDRCKPSAISYQPLDQGRWVAERAGCFVSFVVGENGTRGGATCTNERPPTWTKLSSRAVSRAFTASFTRERGTKLPKNVSSSCSSAATTHSRYLESNALRASATEKLMPSRTASGAQR